MRLKEQLKNDVTDAMRSGEEQRRDVLRLLLAAVKQEEVDRGHDLSDAEVQEIVAKQAKQRRESISDAQRAGRDELAAMEEAELAVIENYLPQQMSRDEIRAAAQQVIDDLGVEDLSGMGQVMGRLMPQLKGQADGQVVSDVVRDLLR